MTMLNENRANGSAERKAFAHFLRTGRRLKASPADLDDRTAELKFNPYHDDLGRFTYAPGGPRSGSPSVAPVPSAGRVGPASANQTRPPAGSGSRPGRGHNRPPADPILIEAAFPGLPNAPAGSIIGVADGFFNLTGPARLATGAMTDGVSRSLIRQIQQVDPAYRFESLGPPATMQGQINQINSLRMDRAATFYRMQQDARPLQVETLRHVQERVDAAFVRGTTLFEAGKLQPRLSRNEAIGNFVDQQVRRDLREFYRINGISIERGENVQVNRRAPNTAEGNFTIPDSRVGNVAFDVSLTAKRPGSRQIMGFFRSDFKPSSVVIIRPSQLGPGHTYIITRPSGM